MLFRNKNKQLEGRRRPLAERQSPAAFSYYARPRTERSTTPREAGRRDSKQGLPVWEHLLQKFGLVILLIVVVVGLVSALSLSTNPRIIAVSGTSSQYFLHDNATYEQVGTSILSSSIWNRNKVTINPSSVSKQLKSRFPELADVSLALPFLGHRPIIYIQPQKPALIIASSHSGSYVVDEHGTALLATTELPATSQLDLPVVTDQAGLSVHSGTQILTADDVAFIVNVVAQLKAHNIAIESLTLPSGTSELDLRINGKPYFVKFNMRASLASARQQAGTFIAVKNRLENQHITPGQYIDVRVDGRAYYQ